MMFLNGGLATPRACCHALSARNMKGPSICVRSSTQCTPILVSYLHENKKGSSSTIVEDEPFWFGGGATPPGAFPRGATGLFADNRWPRLRSRLPAGGGTLGRLDRGILAEEECQHDGGGAANHRDREGNIDTVGLGHRHDVLRYIVRRELCRQLGPCCAAYVCAYCCPNCCVACCTHAWICAVCCGAAAP